MTLENGGIIQYLSGGIKTADVSVIICALPSRPDLLSEAISGIVEQTVPPRAAYIGIDFALIGEAQNQNRMINIVDTEWIAFCHDDDVWLPNHLEEMLKISQDADVIFSDYYLEGRGDWHPGHYCSSWEKLLETNWIPPSAAMIRTDVFRAIGGWQQMNHMRDWVDWKTWQRLYLDGYRMKCTCKKTFRYRFEVNENHKNGSWSSQW